MVIPARQMDNCIFSKVKGAAKVKGFDFDKCVVHKKQTCLKVNMTYVVSSPQSNWYCRKNPAGNSETFDLSKSIRSKYQWGMIFRNDYLWKDVYENQTRGSGMNCQLIEGFPRFLYQALQTGAISTPGTVTISARTFQLCPILFLFIHFILLSFYPTYRYLFYFFFFFCSTHFSPAHSHFVPLMYLLFSLFPTVYINSSGGIMTASPWVYTKYNILLQ